jgi:hypothetical protein
MLPAKPASAAAASGNVGHCDELARRPAMKAFLRPRKCDMKASQPLDDRISGVPVPMQRAIR